MFQDFFEKQRPPAIKNGTFELTDRVRKIVNNGTILDKGILYTSNEVINLQSTGNTYAEAKVDVVDVGSLKSVYVDDGGSVYRIGDALTFTGGGSHSSTAAGFVGIWISK